jgi:hypothetical protein
MIYNEPMRRSLLYRVSMFAALAGCVVSLAICIGAWTIITAIRSGLGSGPLAALEEQMLYTFATIPVLDQVLRTLYSIGSVLGCALFALLLTFTHDLLRARQQGHSTPWFVYARVLLCGAGILLWLTMEPGYSTQFSRIDVNTGLPHPYFEKAQAAGLILGMAARLLAGGLLIVQGFWLASMRRKPPQPTLDARAIARNPGLRP